MSHVLRRALRLGGCALLGLFAMELLLPFACGSALDGATTATARSRAFHRGLLRPDRETLERLRESAFLNQDESAASSFSAPGPSLLGIEIRTNAHGMRMREIERKKPTARQRIAVLGDSVSFGWRVVESACWPRVLERRLRAAGQELEVLNFAVPGYTTAQAAAQLRARVLDFEPDLVVLATGFNDHWLRPGPNDLQRLSSAASTSALAQALFVWRRESPCLRAARRLLELPEPGAPSGGAPLERRAPLADVERALEDCLELCRRAGATLVLADLCLPHARTGDALRAFAERAELPFFAARAALGVSTAPATPLATARRFRALLEPGLRARWDAGRDELLALAFPPDRVRDLADLMLSPLRRDGAEAWLELEAGAPRDWALVPRSYLEASGSLERLMTLVYHRLEEGPGDGELRVGRFAGAAYDCADAPYVELAHGEAIHPNAAGHAALGASFTRFFLERPELLEGAGRRGRR
ncbi:MAG: hypothetical protein IPN34_10265 [Planctomycetes bacterium]|nr:hypothetical protein [Planctomycetota bacterium]